MSQNFVNLRAFTTASINYGLFDISGAIQKCINSPEEYYPSFAVTEKNNMYSVIDFYKKTTANNSDDFNFNPIIGIELDFVHEREIVQNVLEDEKNVEIKKTSPTKYPLLMIAKNNTGYQNLCKLQTIFYKSKNQDRITEKDLSNKTELLDDIFVLSGGNNGFLFNEFKKIYNYSDNNPNKNKLISEVKENIINHIQFWKEKTNGNYLIELQRDGTKYENEYIKYIIPIAIELGVPVIATNNTYFLNREDYKYHELFMANKNDYSPFINSHKPVNATPENYLKSSSEMSELFKDIPVAIKNTELIAKNCNVKFELNKHNYLPEIPSPDPNESIEEYFARLSNEGLEKRLLYLLKMYGNHDTVLENEYPENKYFNKFKEWQKLEIDTDFLTEKEQLNLIKNTSIYKEYKERLDYEIDVIKKMKFPSYFLVVADFIKWSKDNHVPVGPGRGSGAGSLVAYSLGITNLDPLQFDLLFERFLNPERVSMPDFDIDFSSVDRDRVIQYVKRKYNKNNDIYVASIMNVNKYELKSSIDMAAKSFKIKNNHPMVKAIKDLVIDDKNEVVENNYDEEENVYFDVDDIEDEDLNNNFFDDIKDSHEFNIRYRSSSLFKDIINLASKYYKNMRAVSRHAAGLVISSQPLDNILPIIKDGSHDVTQLNKDNSEALGVIKFDFLALENLNVMRNCIKEINKTRRENGQEEFTIETLDDINIYDKTVYENIYQKGNTNNVFQFASNGMMEMLKEYKPDCFEDLVALVSLYRPGPMDIIPDYIKTKKGLRSVDNLVPSCPEVAEILKPTYGFIVYQEQVMQISQAFAGYSYGEADLLRRAMGKKKPEEMEKQKKIFIEKAINRYPENMKEKIEKEAKHIFEYMEKFASYGFNKSHAAAYAMVSFQTAWLKHYYPKEYMMSVLQSNIRTQKKNYVIELNLYDALNNGVPIKGLDINSSKENFYLNENGEIVMPFKIMKNLNKNIAISITNLRDKIIERDNKTKAFDNVYNFVEEIVNDNINLSKEILINLIKVGAFSEILPFSETKKIIENAQEIINVNMNNKINVKSPLLKSVPSSELKSIAKNKNKTVDFKDIDDTIEYAEEMKNIVDLMEFIFDDKRIKTLYKINNGILSMFEDEEHNQNMKNIVSRVVDVKSKLLTMLVDEVNSYNKQMENGNGYFSPFGIKDEFITNGYIIEIKDFNNSKKFKIMTDVGIIDVESNDVNEEIDNLNLELFKNYYFVLNINLSNKYHPEKEIEPTFRYKIKDIFPTLNLLEQVIKKDDEQPNAPLAIIAHEDNLEIDVEKVKNIIRKNISKEENNNVEKIKVILEDEIIDIELTEKLAFDFKKNKLKFNISINQNYIKNNLVQIKNLDGNISGIVNIEDMMEVLHNNETFNKFNSNVILSNKRIENETNPKLKEHLIYGYIKENKKYKGKLSNLIFVDELGQEINISNKNAPEEFKPKINNNKPCLIKVNFESKFGNGATIIKLVDVYYEDDIKKISNKNNTFAVDYHKYNDMVKFIKDYEDINNLKIIVDDNAFIKKEVNEEYKKYENVNYIKIKSNFTNEMYHSNIQPEFIIIENNKNLINELNTKFKLTPLFHFDKKYITAANMPNNYEPLKSEIVLEEKNKEKTIVPYLSKYGIGKEYFKEVNSDNFYRLNRLYLDERKTHDVKTKITDSFMNLENIHNYLSELASNKEKFMSMVKVAGIEQTKNKNKYIIKFLDNTDSLKLMLNKEDFEKFDYQKAFDNQENIVLKIKTSLYEKNNTIYVNVLDTYTMEETMGNLINSIFINTSNNNYDLLENIVKQFPLSKNSKSIPLIIKDRVNGDTNKAPIVANYSNELIEAIKENLNLEEKDLYLYIPKNNPRIHMEFPDKSNYIPSKKTAYKKY